MKKVPDAYCVTPGVVPAGEESTLVVTPLDAGRLFSDTAEYEVDILPLTRKRLLEGPDFVLRGQGGALRFSYFFEGEEEYFIKIYRRVDGAREKQLASLSVYALLPDLYRLRPLKGDLHVHSLRSDGMEEPAVVAANHRSCGFDFVAITDHNRYFPSMEAREAFEGLGSGLLILNGEEVHTPGTGVHIVHVGGRRSVAQRYVKFRDEYEAEVAEIEKNLPENERGEAFILARTRWAVENIHAAEGLAILPHPYWIPKNGVYNLPDALTEMLFKSKLFDAYELVGAMDENGGNNRSAAKFAQMRAEGVDLPIVGSSDAHGTLGYPRFNEYYTVALAEEKAREGVLGAIKSGLTVAVETMRDTDGKCYIVHGSYRLMSYARFLLDHYFPRYTEICQSESFFIRATLTGHEPARALVGICAGMAEDYTRRFFGQAPALLPPAAALERSEKWGAVWAEYGVAKRGSRIE